jgi:hypothetical protein
VRELKYIIGMIASVIAATFGALFALAHSRMQEHHTRIFYAGITRLYLTAPAAFFSACAPWVLFVPGAMAILVVIFAKKDRVPDAAVAVHTAFGWLFALGWSLGCIVAWEHALG